MSEMPIHYKTRRVLSWASRLDINALDQATRTAALPFVETPLALMPDAHLGMGATVGSVIATKGAIIPSAVGVDIGCGMLAAKLPIRQEQLPDNLDASHALIARSVPAGIPTKHNKGNGSHGRDVVTVIPSGPPAVVGQDLLDRAHRQMGTLGSGNHFVELTVADDGGVWLVLHSGSRGVGNKIAQYHIAEAKGLMKTYFIELEDPDLAYLVQGTSPFHDYIHDMQWAQRYAAMNREHMAKRILHELSEAWKINLSPLQIINCHHNYTTCEHHRGQDMWVTRKGAIKADVGDYGVIPGSMATGSFIVRGKGNPASFNSASHGAGRTMSRTRARKELTAESLDTRMSGIAWNHQAETLLDEHPDAYKDLGQVMADQEDLVEIVHQLTTVLNFKGA